MVGVAVGLGNVWRFPYMVGRFGGAAFVAVYVVMVAAIGVPALMAEWTLGRHTRMGTVGAFAQAGLPLGRFVGWFFFLVVTAATAYYTNVVGWVLFFAAAEVADAVGISWNAAAILPPSTGFDARAFGLQAVCTAIVVASCALVLVRGLRRGIEPVSRFIVPALFVILVLLIARAVTLDGAGDGVRWYVMKLDLAAIGPEVALAAMGQAVFSLSLGGTFMVVYGSYLAGNTPLFRQAGLAAFGDTAAGLLAGLAIFPAVFAFGVEPASGPGLLFSTLPAVFDAMPAGWLFGLLFFVALFGAAFLSDIAAFEVLIAGLTDNTGLSRRAAVWLMAGVVLLFAVPPMINMAVFVPWDLTFGSGMQVLGSLLAVITVGWVLNRSVAIRELGLEGRRWLYYWLRFVVPGGIVTVGAWWAVTVSRGQ